MARPIPNTNTIRPLFTIFMLVPAATALCTSKDKVVEAFAELQPPSTNLTSGCITATLSQRDVAAAEVYRSDGRNGEANSAMLETLYHEASKSASTIFIVSHLGTGEWDRPLHERRLHNVQARFTYSGRRLLRQRIVVAMGERKAGKGTIRIYFDGVLRFLSEIERGKDIQVDCCELFPEYYPWRRGRPRLSF